MEFLNGKTMLITGGSGYLGKVLIKYLITTNIKKIIVYSRDEYKQWQLKEKFKDPRIRYFIGDVRDYDRLGMAMRNVDIVIHAAAMKRIESCEYDPLEAIKTNVYGTENIIKAALYNHVEKVVNVSTDKAVNPSCLYGTTKQLSERLMIDANGYSNGTTKFANIRCGNFAGSTGSIVPFYWSLMSDDKTTFPLTDERMTRYWMGVEDIIGLILFALTNIEGGEIFVKKLYSFKMIDLISAFHLLKKEGINFNIVGIRPKEKLHEEMIDLNENVVVNGEFFTIYSDSQSNSQHIKLASDHNDFYQIDELRERIMGLKYEA